MKRAINNRTKGQGHHDMITLENSTLFHQLNELLNDPLVYNGNHKFTIEDIGANWLWLFNPQKDQSGLQQQGLADIYTFKNSKQKNLCHTL